MFHFFIFYEHQEFLLMNRKIRYPAIYSVYRAKSGKIYVEIYRQHLHRLN